MKAVVKAKAEPGLWLEEVPVPTIGGGDVLIRVLKASICGTDVRIYNWDAWAQRAIPVPMIIGHEFVGIVDRVGDHVKGFARGDLVVGGGPHHLRARGRARLVKCLGSPRKSEDVRHGQTPSNISSLGDGGTRVL
jgi:threonine dehydrogenase-like Zn-dependent dehydrogenase